MEIKNPALGLAFIYACCGLVAFLVSQHWEGRVFAFVILATVNTVWIILYIKKRNRR